MMATLIWKDIRQNLPIVVVALVLPFVPLLVLLSFWIVGKLNGTWSSEAPGVLVLGLPGAYGLAIMSAWLMGCCILASERQDGSCEFLACLPVSRWKVIESKLLVVASIIFLLFALLSLLGYIGVQSLSQNMKQQYLVVSVAWFLPIGLFVSGIGWLLSTMIRNVLLVTFGSLVISISIMIACESMMYVWAGGERLAFPYVIAVIFLAGVALFTVGSVVYARRITP